MDKERTTGFMNPVSRSHTSKFCSFYVVCNLVLKYRGPPYLSTLFSDEEAADISSAASPQPTRKSSLVFACPFVGDHS